MADCLIHESRGGVIRLTLNRPQQRTLSPVSCCCGWRTASPIRSDRSARVVVLAGAGPIFSSGHDLAESWAVRSTTTESSSSCAAG